MDNNELNEKSLGRIYQHIQKEKVQSWAILTSYRDENSPDKNKNDFKELQSKVRSMNLGFIRLVGYGQEESDDGIISVKEPSIFIPGILMNQAQKLASHYNQWGYLYSGEEIDGDIALIETDGQKIVSKFKKFIPNKIAQFYSKIKGKPFVFEDVLPTSIMERWIKKLQEEI